MKDKYNIELYGIIRSGTQDEAEAAIAELKRRDLEIVDLFQTVSRISKKIFDALKSIDKEHADER